MDERLFRFVPSEWPGDVQDAWQAWRAARMAYVDEHPDGALGDPVDEIRGRAAVRRRFWL